MDDDEYRPHDLRKVRTFRTSLCTHTFEKTKFVASRGSIHVLSLFSTSLSEHLSGPETPGV